MNPLSSVVWWDALALSKGQFLGLDCNRIARLHRTMNFMSFTFYLRAQLWDLKQH